MAHTQTRDLCKKSFWCSLFLAHFKTKNKLLSKHNLSVSYLAGRWRTRSYLKTFSHLRDFRLFFPLRPRLCRSLFESSKFVAVLELSSSSEEFLEVVSIFKLPASCSTEEALELSLDTSIDTSKEESSISPFARCPSWLMCARRRRLSDSVCRAADFWKYRSS